MACTLFIIVGGTVYSSLVISVSGSGSVGLNSYPRVVVLCSLPRLFTPTVLLSARHLNLMCVCERWRGRGLVKVWTVKTWMD